MFVEIFREAWAALGRNPVRSLLTMTGNFLGHRRGDAAAELRVGIPQRA